MSGFSESCGDYRESVCLLAIGSLPPQERAGVENHLALCLECRKYHDEIAAVSGELGQWQANSKGLEPSAAAQARWAREFEAAIHPGRPAWISYGEKVLDWCGDMIWPCRRIWAGLATIWLALLAVNLSQRDSSQFQASGTTRPSPELVRAFLEHEGFLVESKGRPDKTMAEPPKPPAQPSRSERRRENLQA